MKRDDGVVIGVDGGGTHTRVLVVDRCGHALSYVEKGAASIYKDRQASENVQQAIVQALKEAGKEKNHVHMLVAGIAGLDKPEDMIWVEQLTQIKDILCPRVHVNDTVVAHIGALQAEPGIIVIAGTGSNIYAVNESGETFRNYDFRHYAATAARFLAYDAVFELLAGKWDESDKSLVDEILHFWQQPTTVGLSQLASKGFLSDDRARDRQFARLAPIVTTAAAAGSSLAQRVCDRAIDQVMVGIELLASHFSSTEVKVSFTGSVIGSAYFQQQLTTRLSRGNNKDYRLVNPRFSPVVGAVLLALKELEQPIDGQLMTNLAGTSALFLKSYTSKS